MSLFSIIRAAIINQYSNGETGLTVISTSGNGRSVSFLMPDFRKTFTQDDARHLWVQMLKTYNTAVEKLIHEGTIAAVPAIGDSSQDQTIVNKMLCSNWCATITEHYNDLTLLRLLPTDNDADLHHLLW